VALLSGALVAMPARAQRLSPRVVQVVGATADVHDVAAMGPRVLAATSGGLAVVREGRVERVLTTRDGLPGTRLRSVSVTPEGAWVGTVEGAALLRWEGERAVVARSLALPRVRRVVAWRGETWFGSQGGGLVRLAGTPGAVPTPVPLGRHHALGLVTDLLVRGDELWVATAGAGVLRLGPGGAVLGRVTAARGLSDDVVWDLEPDGARVLVATVGGVSVLGATGVVVSEARETHASQRLPLRDVRALAITPEGLLLGTSGAGAFRLAPRVPGATPLSTEGANARVRALAHIDGVLYLARDDGLDVFTRDGARHAVLEGGLPSADVTSLARAMGTMWIGTFDRGLSRMDGNVVSAVAAPGVDRRINDLAVTRDAAGREALWIATDRGLYLHDGGGFVPVTGEGAPGREHTTALHVDPRTGDLWVASSRALSRYRAGQWTSWRGDERVQVLQLHAVTVDAHGGVWAGSLHGLLHLDPTTGSLARHSVSTGALPVDWVTAVAPWGEGIVAGTYHGGLAWFDGRAFRAERERDGLPSGWINPHAFAVIDGALFAGTLERGLMVGHRGAWALLDLRAGLPGADVTAVLPDGERAAWVATRAGLARVAWDAAPAR
jgi:ligand-binding sensor domain-containing protein